MNEQETVVLQVELAARPELVTDYEAMKKRFGPAYDGGTRIEYLVTCDSHGFDVFRDEFEEGQFMELDLDYTALVVLPYPPEQFKPFTEESAGVVLAEYDEGGWVPA